MNLVSLERVGVRHAEKQVLSDVTLGIDEGDRVGVIGANGSGKSTLLRLIAGAGEPDAGRVVHARSVRVSYVPQEPSLDPSTTVFDAVVDASTPAGAALQAFEHATAAVRRSPGDAAAAERLSQATRRMDAESAWDLEARARAILDHLGLADLERPVGSLSGGQRKRVALARALVDDPTGTGGVDGLLVLDEPTNHLDVDVVEWLEDTLYARTGALVLVTHDRYLLDRVATRVVELVDGALHSGYGSYADYLEARALREQQALAAEQRRANRARVELEWLRRGPKARTSKAKHRVERARELITAEAPRSRQDVTIDLPSRRIGSKVVNLHNVGKRYGDHVVLRGVDHKLAPSDRIGVVGPNGSGKTTLLRLISGDLEPDEGKVAIGDTVVVGRYGQDPTPLPPRTRVLDAVKEVVLETNTVEGITLSAAQLLERFLFSAEAQRAYVSELSGGERRRLELLRVLALAPNLLVLDEPTNDLDLDTLAVLEEYLDAWPGALVVASHDRYFLDRVCRDLFSIEPDGSVRHHPGGWSAYRQRQAEQQAAAAAARRRAEQDRRPRGSDRGSRPGPRKLSYAERRELQRIEQRLPQLEARKAELTASLQAAGDDYAAAQRAGDELAAVLGELEAAESRWLELATIGEQ